MTDAATLAAFATTSLLIELTPGPNMAYLSLVAATEGRAKGYAAVAGVALGLAVVGALAAAGLAALVAGVPVAYQALRWGGAAYLLWIAWEGWRDAARADEAVEGTTAGQQFRRGVITNLLNPKAFVFYVAVLPTFLPPAPALSDVAPLTAIYVAVATGVHAAIVTLAGTLRAWLAHPTRERAVRRGLAVALAGVAVWILAAT